MQRLKRISLLVFTNLLIMAGVYLIIFVLERFFGLQLGENVIGILFYGLII
jgi:hypothetical protein